MFEVLSTTFGVLWLNTLTRSISFSNSSSRQWVVRVVGKFAHILFALLRVIMGQQAGVQTKHRNLGPSLFPTKTEIQIFARKKKQS